MCCHPAVRCWCLLLSGALLGTSVSLAPAYGEAGTVVAVQRFVERWSADNVDAKVRAREGDPLAEQDWLRTGARSTATVRLLEEDEIEVREKTTIQVAELARLDGGKATVLDLRLGEVYSKVGTFSDARDRFEVRTPTATAAVRGTRFIVTYEVPRDATAEGGFTTVRVLEGLVEVEVRRTEERIELDQEDDFLRIGPSGVMAEPAETGEEFETIESQLQGEADAIEREIETGRTTTVGDEVQELGTGVDYGDDTDDW